LRHSAEAPRAGHRPSDASERTAKVSSSLLRLSPLSRLLPVVLGHRSNRRGHLSIPGDWLWVDFTVLKRHPLLKCRRQSCAATTHPDAMLTVCPRRPVATLTMSLLLFGPGIRSESVGGFCCVEAVA